MRETNETNCTHKNLFDSDLSTSEKCNNIARETCGELFETVNFFSFYFCYLNEYLWIFLPYAIFIIYLIFKFISATVEEYIAPSITYLSKALKLSEALAGVTLLAFANGAGDFISALVASGSTEGVSYNIGSIFGKLSFLFSHFPFSSNYSLSQHFSSLSSRCWTLRVRVWNFLLTFNLVALLSSE